MSDQGVCHIPPKNEVGNPQPHDLPGLPGPVTPPMNASPAAMMAAMNDYARLLNMLLRLLQHMTQQTPVTNNAVSKQPSPQWTEQGRTTQKVRVFQGNDRTSPNYVDVEQINSLTMHDKNTKQTWKWTR